MPVIARPPFHLDSHAQELACGQHHEPHAILGLHETTDGKVIRLWRPGAPYVYVDIGGQHCQMQRIHDEGLFELKVPKTTGPLDYKVFHQEGLCAHDPYAFLPTFGEMDNHLFHRGVHYELYHVMGARLTTHQGVEGVKVAVWAPNAQRVSLVGDFNHWNGRMNPMRSMGYSGVWELFIPGLPEGSLYKFEILSEHGELFLKTDPYALSSELRPKTASCVARLDRHVWQDEGWVRSRANRQQLGTPLAIYEVHLGSWRLQDGHFLNFRDIAHTLAPYCRDMGFTHVELLPVAEHPLDESWGYQVTGFYAVTRRFGTPEDFQYFVDFFHQHEIGVLLDWVPGHFPTDAFSLARFDGSHLYEHADPRQGLHPHWNTHIFNYGRKEVSNFLLANALFWCHAMHIDGLRVDAVASMLYLDYGREHGDWIPNRFGGKENLEAIEFLKHVNAIVHEKVPGVLTIAEESTSFSKVSHPLWAGGLGFDYKWNMGWMNDTLRYMHKDPIFRSYHQGELTFGLLYAFSERFIGVLSHDEVVHGKKSLLSKMPGDYWQKFANLRLLYSYMICQPGKKLLFMGGELGEWEEWSCKRSLEWSLLDYPIHAGLKACIRDLNLFYQAHGELWERDHHHDSFEWVNFADTHNCVISYKRKGSLGQILCVHNFTPNYHGEYFLPLVGYTGVEEIFNTDAACYGGSGQHAHPRLDRHHHHPSHGLRFSLAPLATMIFRIS